MSSVASKETLKVVGTRPIRPDGVDKVTGRANFGADMALSGMLWVAITGEIDPNLADFGEAQIRMVRSCQRHSPSLTTAGLARRTRLLRERRG